ncbi:CD109 antigen-like isoform X2 [Acanthopagrus latus]|uniref:CD109 antigen-like isoform X2 n=1 Tax=Acanthopagrus latus TaxID=8177 RepID=UPI00187CEC00|nr:CD109 antigen-like isoform X2 [Acanthopagrus latus]
MDWIWTLLVCLGVVWCPAPGSTQDSPKTLFLISSPEVVHAGASTPLAVTVLADFPVRLMAEVEHGNASAAQTEDFEGGVTRVLTLPPVLGSVTQNSPLNLRVSGYKGADLIFTNTTTLTFRNVSSFIQTDRSRYQPGDTVKIRVVSVQSHNHPYKGRVDISVQDPSGNIVDSWESTGNLGIVLREFILSQAPPLGQWAVTTTVNGVIDERAFLVEHHDRPPFGVLLKTPSQVLAGGDITGSVRALYPSGQPVRGTLAISVTLVSVTQYAAAPFMQTQTKGIYGSAQFFFSKEQLQALPSDGRLHVTACVTDGITGFKLNKTVEVHLMRNIFQLEFRDFPPKLKPSLHFSSTLRISRYDGKPLGSEDLMYSAVIEVTQRTSAMSDEPTTLTLPVPEDGNVHIKFKLQEQVVTLFIRARFQSSEQTLMLYNNHSSPSGSYIQISPISSTAQIGDPLQLDVESTFPLTKLHFVVSSGGQVVSAGTESSSSFSVTPTASWSPEACVTVYCILSDGEVTSDTVHVSINQDNHVSLEWSSDRAQPGVQVSLALSPLEAPFHVGVMVMGTHSDTPRADLNLKVMQECNIKTLTNARLYEEKQHDGNEGDALLVEKYWDHWMEATEPLLWLDTYVSDETGASWKVTVPDGVSSLRAVALVMSDNMGLDFTPVPRELSVSKDFSLSLDAPSHLIRGEEIVLEVNVVNHLAHDIEVILLLAQSEAYEFVLEDGQEISVINAHKLSLGSHGSASALFAIRAVALGVMEVSVDAVSAEASDSLVWTVLVKPEGVERSFSETLFLELVQRNSSTSASYSYPPDVVPGSRRAHVALVGDIIATAIEHMNLLVQKPLGCGEQNMIHFAPSVYVLQYLDMSAQDDEDIRSRALRFMMEGYQRQLSYQRNDGSFAAFGASDTSGSTWLTAFVLKCFIQAQPYMQVDQSVLSRAVAWLVKQQGPQGEFSEAGRLIHTEMQGGLDNGPVALTAFVLIALLEDESYADMYPSNVSLAVRYLEDKVSSGVVSNYSLCLVAYALSQANSPVAGTALDELKRRADYRDGVMTWASSAGLDSHDWQPRSAQIEMTSYVLLAFFRRGSLVEGFVLMKWLSKQRNHLGGYGTTQDTVVALQALAIYAALSGANAINLMVKISSPTSSFVSLFHINSTTYRTYQSRQIDADKDVNLNIYMEGRGFAMVQIIIFYNLESKAFSKSLATAQEAFSLSVDGTGDTDHNHLQLSICMRLKDDQLISQTGMAILDVGMLSGFSLPPAAAAPTDLIRKVEIQPEKVSLYLDSITKSEVCIKLPFVRDYKMAHLQDAVVEVFDYYEPTRKATRTYNSDVLNIMDVCSYCGEDCQRCRPGITFAVTSRSMSGATHSLSCLFLAVTAFFFVV